MKDQSNTLHKEVLEFISRFTLDGKYDQVIEAFTCGCCYWFAFILCTRFMPAKLMYDEVANHFAAEIDGVPYDITGDITGKYDMKPWIDIDDELLRSRIIWDCILFERIDET